MTPELAAMIEEVLRLDGEATPKWAAEGDYVSGAVPGGRPNGEIIGRLAPSISALVPATQRKTNATCAAYYRTAAPALAKALAESEAEKEKAWKVASDFEESYETAIDVVKRFAAHDSCPCNTSDCDKYRALLAEARAHLTPPPASEAEKNECSHVTSEISRPPWREDRGLVSVRMCVKCGATFNVPLDSPQEDEKRESREPEEKT